MTSPLDQLLLDHGFSLGPNGGSRAEGYLTESQKLQFQNRLKTYPPIQTIAEIGLNAGHSAENFLISCPDLKKLVSFDLCFYEYTDYAVDYLQKNYGCKFHFIKGDSRQTVNEHAKDYPEKTFDLIYIDGNHLYDCCLADLLNCANIAHSGTILWMDDYQYLPVFLAIHEQVHAGLIELIDIHESMDPIGGLRCWAEAKYLCPKKTM